MKKYTNAFLSFLSVILLLSASVFAEETKKEWTFLIFLNADSNLHQAGYDDIHEMEKVGSTKDVNIVVQFDYLRPAGTKRIYIEQNKTGRYPDGNQSFTSPVLELMEEQDMGSIDTFVDFVSWGMETYPAKNYLVTLWNHGSGWSFLPIQEINRSISYDDSSGNHIRTNELAGGFDEIIARTGQKPTIIGFDACLMAMYEVADSLVGFADYMVGSSETEPFDGWPYDDLLNRFTKRSDLSAESLVKDIVETYGESYSEGGSQGYKLMTTQSGIKLSELSLVKHRLNTWLGEVENHPDLTQEDLLEAASQTTRFYDSDYRDLGDYVGLLLDKEAGRGDRALDAPGFIGASLELRQAIDKAVIAKYGSSAFDNATGLAVYLPYGWNGTYSEWNQPYGKQRRANYMDLHWTKTTNWASHLDTLFPPLQD